MCLNRTSEWKVMTVWYSRELLLFNFECLDISWASIIHTRVNIYGRLSLPRAFMFKFERLDILLALIDHPSQKLWCLNFPCTSMFNFEGLDILCAWIGHLSEKLWSFEFPESFYCSISSVSIYYRPQSYTRVKIYCLLNLSRDFLFKFECLDILLAWIGHPSQKLWPLEFVLRFHV